MPGKPELRLDWCSHEAAKYAVEHWHYSRSMPCGKVVKVGVWENGVFIGCVIFARGAAKNLGAPYGLSQTQLCELARVALDAHENHVSRIIAISLRMLKKLMPSIRLVVSFADMDQRHYGGVYQAGGWVYTGTTGKHWMFKNNRGEMLHPRQVSVSGWRPEFGVPKRVNRIKDCQKIRAEGKHRYLMPLDDEMRRQIEPLRKPYPKRAGSAESGTAGIQPVGGGANPTPALLSP